MVIVLTFVTLGIYLWYWAWKSTEAADAFDRRGSSAHTPTKFGLFASIAGGLMVGIGFLVLVGAAGAAGNQAATPDELAGAGVASLVLWGIGGLIALGGSIGLLVGFWRLWKFIGFHEAQIGYRDTLSAGTMLAIYFGGNVVGSILFIILIGPLIAMAASGYVLYRTQKGLNRVWRAARDGYEPPEGPQPGVPQSPQTANPPRA
jgi:formate/nitrite transporter FocA (FNT family)